MHCNWEHGHSRCAPDYPLSQYCFDQIDNMAFDPVAAASAAAPSPPGPPHDAQPQATSLTSRISKRARSGPDSCVAPGRDSAISAAIRSASADNRRYIFFPAEGTSFSSKEEAREFYNLYSWEMGFGIRYGRVRPNTNEYRTKQELVCSCEGKPKKQNSRSCRTSCKAMIRLLRKGDHSWYVSKVVTEHNHPLSEGCGEKKQWNLHGEIDAVTKDFIRQLRQNNISIGRVCGILGVFSGAQGIPTISKEVVRSVCAKIAQENIKDDIGKTMCLLDKMKEEDPSLTVHMDTDEEGRIVSLLWCTGKNRMDYAKLGDVVTFDTTYRTNLYNLPFGLFVEVNNHFQSIIYGCVLLTRETTKDFEWAFSTFVKTTVGKEPVTILTVPGHGSCPEINTAKYKTPLVPVAHAEESERRSG